MEDKNGDGEAYSFGYRAVAGGEEGGEAVISRNWILHARRSIRQAVPI